MPKKNKVRETVGDLTIQALALADAGRTRREIASLLRVSLWKAHTLVATARDRPEFESPTAKNHALAVELDKLDLLEEECVTLLHDPAPDVRLKAVKEFRQIIEQRCEVLGLCAPLRHEITTTSIAANIVCELVPRNQAEIEFCDRVLASTATAIQKNTNGKLSETDA